MGKSVVGMWSELNNKRMGLLSRCERYSQLTIPSICPEDGYSEQSDELRHDFQSVGVTAVNNLVNKMMLAMFAPSRPFMRYTLPQAQLNRILKATGLSEAQLREELSATEMDTVRELDNLGLRPKLYELMAHLIVTGNACRLMQDDVMRVIGIKNYVVCRDNTGKMLQLIIKERCVVRELAPELAALADSNESAEVDFYRWWWWEPARKQYIERQYIGDKEIRDPKYQGRYKEQDLPVQAHYWRLPDSKDYGIGHVEDFVGDFEGCSQLSEAELNAAMLASEFRWLMDPAGNMRPEDFKRSRNGDVIPGTEGQLVLVSAGAIANTITVVSASADKYIRRISQGFLITQGLVRDAERVTAEEIRVLANDLETQLGGIYSLLALNLQQPLAMWLMNRVNGSTLKGTSISPTIVTGLDALSRNGDLENVRLFIADVAQITALPPETQKWLKLGPILSELAAGRGLRSSQYVATAEEVQQADQAEQDRQVQLLQQQAALKGQPTR
ncbi:portal protein [Aeromonas phage yong1]|uniref:Portal protein n=1 Tax=Aeromonas phage yong1 TaxID=2924882 RepID=A0A9X9E523_9CAUD|nr:portal protein [Aeromonas phage yong1]